MAAAQRAIVDSGAYNWQLMANSFTAAGPPWGASPKNNCTTYLRKACVADSAVANSPLFYGFDRGGPSAVHDGTLPHLLRDLVGFLLVRGPYAWLGYSVSGHAVSYPTFIHVP